MFNAITRQLAFDTEPIGIRTSVKTRTHNIHGASLPAVSSLLLTLGRSLRRTAVSLYPVRVKCLLHSPPLSVRSQIRGRHHRPHWAGAGPAPVACAFCRTALRGVRMRATDDVAAFFLGLFPMRCYSHCEIDSWSNFVWSLMSRMDVVFSVSWHRCFSLVDIINHLPPPYIILLSLPLLTKSAIPPRALFPSKPLFLLDLYLSCILSF